MDDYEGIDLAPSDCGCNDCEERRQRAFKDGQEAARKSFGKIGVLLQKAKKLRLRRASSRS